MSLSIHPSSPHYLPISESPQPTAFPRFGYIHIRDDSSIITTTTTICSTLSNLCAASLGGGCCPESYACIDNACSTTTLPESTCSGHVGEYACKITDGGGCCSMGWLCNGLNNCTAPKTTYTDETITQGPATKTSYETTITKSSATSTGTGTSSHHNLSTGAIVGISLGSLAFLILVVLLVLNLHSIVQNRRAWQAAIRSKNHSVTSGRPGGAPSMNNAMLAAGISRPGGVKPRDGLVKYTGMRDVQGTSWRESAVSGSAVAGGVAGYEPVATREEDVWRGPEQTEAWELDAEPISREPSNIPTTTPVPTFGTLSDKRDVAIPHDTGLWKADIPLDNLDILHSEDHQTQPQTKTQTQNPIN